MATYFVDDGGDGTTESTWETADTSINDLDTEYAFASSDIVYFGADHVCQATNSANLVITGPTAGIPVSFISSTVATGTTVSYSASSTAQIDTSEGSYNISFDGSFKLEGLSVKAGNRVVTLADSNEFFFARECRFAIGANASVLFQSNEDYFRDLVVDLTADGSSNRTANVFLSAVGGRTVINGLTFVNAPFRTGEIFAANSIARGYEISGADFSGFTNGTLCELFHPALNGSAINISNSLTAATWAATSGTLSSGGHLFLSNVGPASAPTYLYFGTDRGTVVSSTSIYRSGGATVDGTAVGWLVTTISTASEGSPFEAPWIYFEVDSTGSKTFDVYITNDTADFTDAQAWLEVEYLGTSSEAISSYDDDRRVITTTAANQTDDVTSTWNGSGPSFTFKQSLSVTATVNVAGLHRARVLVGVASIASSRFFYIDPTVTVS
jgi:hypothetical protein